MSHLPPTPGMDPAGDYLWDGSGPADADVARLELLLAPLRAPTEMPARLLDAGAKPLAFRPAPPPPRAATPPRSRGFAWAAAAMLALASGAAMLAWRPAHTWEVQTLAGKAASRPEETGRLAVGQWLRTDASSKVRLEVQGLGWVDVAPGTQVRIKEDARSHKLLDLRRGEIRAMITAEPRMFLVDTPAARAVDLGCFYTLKVGDEGGGELRVELGAVELVGHGRRAMVPMDGVCQTRPGFGPGTPYFEDASERFRSALRELDFGRGGRSALDAVLAEARAKDALSLWHLLSRTQGSDRAAVYDRLAVLRPPPPRITRDGALALDEAILRAWWDDMRPF